MLAIRIRAVPKHNGRINNRNVPSFSTGRKYCTVKTEEKAWREDPTPPDHPLKGWKSPPYWIDEDWLTAEELGKKKRI